MNSFGEVYMMFRKNKGFSRKHATNNEKIMKVQTLGRFENGQSDITTTKLNLLLQKIFVSWKEFIRECDVSDIDDIDNFDLKINHYILKKDRFAMTKLAESFQRKYDLDNSLINLHYCILTEITIQLYWKNSLVTEERINILKTHLTNTTHWTEHEIYIFSSILFLFEPEYVEELLPKIMKRMVKNSTKKEDPANCPYSFLNNVASYFMKEMKLKKAKQVIEIAQSMMRTNERSNLFERILINYNGGVIDVSLGNEAQIETCERCMTALDLIGGYDTVVNTMFDEIESLKRLDRK